MEYIKTDQKHAVEKIAEIINEAQKKGSVLLMLSGGSNIKLEVDIRNSLKIIEQLTISLVDERYGPEGHDDSNWKKLLDAGFDTRNCTLLPVLHNETFEQTAQNYSTLLSNAIASHDTVIGIFGLGSDGHTAGMLPGSSSITDDSLVSCFEGEDYQRITITAVAMKYFNIAYLVAFGENKKDQLERLKQDLPVADQPAQALKQISQLYIFNDQIGE